jgi:hypothetical protein
VAAINLKVDYTKTVTVAITGDILTRGIPGSDWDVWCTAARIVIVEPGTSWSYFIPNSEASTHRKYSFQEGKISHKIPRESAGP